MAWIAEQLLSVIGSHAGKECITFERLVQLSKLKPRQVEHATLKLRKHSLIEVVVCQYTSCYQLTRHGKTALASEAKLRSGPRGEQPGARVHKNSLRTRVWRAIRIRRKFSIPEIEPLVVNGDEKNVRNNIGKYMKALEEAGILVRMKLREDGVDPTSNGHVRWWLPDNKDPGPIAPIWRPTKNTVFDPNTGNEVPLCGENS